MSTQVHVLVGTNKGAFIYTSNDRHAAAAARRRLRGVLDVTPEPAVH